nr:hypothetical protein [Parabacteroides goldsteinii]
MVPPWLAGDSGPSPRWFWHSQQLILACPAGGSSESNRWLRRSWQVVPVCPVGVSGVSGTCFRHV